VTTVLRGAGIGIVVAATLAGTVVLGFRYVGKEPSWELSSRGMSLRGKEEFNGPAGALPNPNYFDYDLGGNGWGNEEKQVYTKNPDNVRLSGTGQLIIEARRVGETFTSARVVTRDKQAFGYGLIEARIKMPEGQGLHPAFWLLGSNIRHVGWPNCGEIDVIEIVNSAKQYHNAIHGPLDADPDTPWKDSHDGDASADLSSDFHVYQVFREPGRIKLGIDGVVVGEYTTVAMPPGARWVLDAPMYINLNIALGGTWPGPIGPSTVFPAAMVIDWIRYWT
jgi:beta-glucanase (GH16 family)